MKKTLDPQKLTLAGLALWLLARFVLNPENFLVSTLAFLATLLFFIGLVGMLQRKFSNRKQSPSSK